MNACDDAETFGLGVERRVLNEAADEFSRPVIRYVKPH